jgi:small subunit ribosomal protein S16
VAVRIRLKRMGAKKRPHYRIVAADSRSPRDGRFIEILGYYNPLTDPATVEVDREKALEWLRRGAELTPTVRSLFAKRGILGDLKAPAEDEGGEAS